MISLCLTNEELIEITGKERFSAQTRVLRQLGFTFVQRKDGKPLLARTHFEAMMHGEHYESKAQDYQPDFSSLNGS